MLPFVLVVSVNLRKLPEWKLLHGLDRASYASTRGEVCEQGNCHDPASAHHGEGLTGHLVMLEEGGVHHRDLDLTPGLAIEGHALGLAIECHASGLEHACDTQPRPLHEGDGD